MATTGIIYPTLADTMRSLGQPGEGLLPIVDRLTQENPIVNTMPVYESNTDMGEKFAATEEEPKVFERDINRGIPASKGSDKQVFEGICEIEKRSVLDEKLVSDAGQLKTLRAQELAKTVSAMGKQMAEKIFYGDAKKNVRSINGLATRLEPGLRAVKNGAGASGKTNLTSLYLVVWDKEKAAYGIYRRGTTAGVEFKDLTPTAPSETQDPTSSAKTYLAYKDWVKWNLGIAVKDNRYIGRLANIDIDTITDDNIISLSRTVANMIENINVGRACWYGNRYLLDRIDAALDKKGNVNYEQNDPTMVGCRKLHRIPMLLCDGIKGGVAGHGEDYVSFA